MFEISTRSLVSPRVITRSTPSAVIDSLSPTSAALTLLMPVAMMSPTTSGSVASSSPATPPVLVLSSELITT